MGVVVTSRLRIEDAFYFILDHYAARSTSNMEFQNIHIRLERMPKAKRAIVPESSHRVLGSNLINKEQSLLVAAV